MAHHLFIAKKEYLARIIYWKSRIGLRLLLGNAVEDVYAAVNGLFRSGVRNPEMGMAFRKDTSGYNEEIFVDSGGNKLFICTPGHLREKVKSPTGFYDSKFVL